MADRSPERQLEHDVDELDHRIGKLEEHIEEAERKAQAARADEVPENEVAGDFEDSEPSPAGGDDPTGAARDRTGDSG
jgi:hypothetical protein